MSREEEDEEEGGRGLAGCHCCCWLLVVNKMRIWQSVQLCAIPSKADFSVVRERDQKVVLMAF